MLEPIEFFDRMPPMRGFRGDTFPVLSIYVDWNYPLTNATMKIRLESKYTPGTIAFEKACAKFTTQGETGFSVQLLDTETANLSGVYNVYFTMFSASTTETVHGYTRLAGTLEILDYPEAGE